MPLRISRVLRRALLGVVAIPLVPLGWYWAGDPGRSCGPADGRALSWIGATMIAAAIASLGFALLGRRLIVGGLVTLVGWIVFIVGLAVAVSCLA